MLHLAANSASHFLNSASLLKVRGGHSVTDTVDLVRGIVGGNLKWSWNYHSSRLSNCWPFVSFSLQPQYLYYVTVNYQPN